MPEDQTDSPRTKRQLEEQLLRAQIEALDRRGWRAWFWHMGPSFTAVLVSVGAGVLVVLFTGEWLRARLASHETRYKEVNQTIDTAQAELLELEAKLAVARRETAKLRDEEASVRDFLTRTGQEEPLDVDVEIEDAGTEYFLNVTTSPASAELSVFSDCRSDFTFPDGMPDTERCLFLFNAECGSEPPKACNEEPCGKAPCRFGPVGKPANWGGSIWVSAELDGARVVRLVHLADQPAKDKRSSRRPDTWSELRSNVREAVAAFQDDSDRLATIRLHLVRNEVLATG